MPIIPIEQLTSPSWCSIANIGPPKSGKTACIGSLYAVLLKRGGPRKIAIFDLDEDGAEPLIRLSRTGRYYPTEKPFSHEVWLEDLIVHRYKRPMGERISDTLDTNRSYDELMDFIHESNSYQDWYGGGSWLDVEHSLGAIVVDSMTALQEMLWDWLLKKRHRSVAGVGGKWVEIQDWQILQEKVLESVKVIKSLPCYTIFNFHENLLMEEVRSNANISGEGGSEEKAVRTTGEYYYLPWTLGQKLSYRIGKEFSVIVYSRSQYGQYTWITRPIAHIKSAGSRGRDDLPESVEQDYGKVFDLTT
jgi:hypothetical protein